MTKKFRITNETGIEHIVKSYTIPFYTENNGGKLVEYMTAGEVVKRCEQLSQWIKLDVSLTIGKDSYIIHIHGPEVMTKRFKVSSDYRGYSDKYDRVSALDTRFQYCVESYINQRSLAGSVSKK